MKHTLILAAAFAALSSTATFAHPHDKEKAEPAKKTWPYFGDSKTTKDTKKVLIIEESKSEEDDSESTELPKALKGMEAYFKKHADRMSKDVERAKRKHSFPEFDGETLMDNPEELREAAKALEDMLAESDILENMASLFIGLAEKIEVDSGDKGMTLRFDGETLGSLNIEREGKMNDLISIEGLGANMEVEKDVIIKNGRKRTRIIIEMDTDEDADIDVKPER